ncbi:MAG: hypothetical protein AAF682_24980 [Planctomycetota bacterium]
MRALLSALLLPLAASAQGQLYVVDDDGGPGVDFTAVHDAIDASSPGDSILVKDGTYFVPAMPFASSTYSITHALTLTAEEGASVNLESPIRVVGLDADETVVLRGLNVDLSFSTSSSYANALEVIFCEGTVWIEDCDLRTSGGLIFVEDFDTPHAVAVDQAKLVMENSTVSGGMVFNLSNLGYTFHAEDAEVYLHNSSILPSETFLIPGSPGVRFFNSFLYASGSTVRGVNGGDATKTIFGPQCGTDGGPAVLLAEGAAGSTAYFLDTELIGGAPGADPDCMAAQQGPGILIDQGQAFFLNGTARSLSAPPTAPAGGQVTLDFDGEPGDLVLLAAGAASAPLFLSAVAGPLLPAGAVAVATVGTTDGAGELSFQAALPPLSAGVGGLTLYLQSVFVGATPVASSASALLVTQPAP